MIETWFFQIANHVALAIEVAVVVVIAYAAAQAMAGTVRLIGVGEQEDRERRHAIWVRFASWIVLGLEFALAADLVRTIIAPSWDDIGKLAAIAAIRTLINYFLEKDIERATENRRARNESATAARQ